MLSFMNNAEKKQFVENLNNRGVKNELDLERLLDKWKNEALNPKIKVERTYKQTIKPRNVEVIHTR